MSVFINLKGGLGNQLFQIANGYAYAKRNNRELILSETWNTMNITRPSYWNNLLQKLNIYLKPKKEFYTHYEEPYFEYKEIPKIDTNIELDGYYQSEKYFSDCKEDIQELFSIPEDLLPSHITPIKHTVAIHIRRGDYLKNPNFHTILEKSYYDKAKLIMEIELGFRPFYIYFSDDYHWVERTFGDSLQEGDVIIKNSNDIQDFIQMRNCHHFIIANSSFSWWAAWLSQTSRQQHNKKIVIAPNQWFGPSMTQNWEDIYCKDWIRI